MTGTTWRPYDGIVDYLDLPASLTLPIWREGRVAREVSASRRMDPAPPTLQPRSVMVVHGFLDDGAGTQRLRDWLAEAGHTVHQAEIGRNVACTEVMARRLERDLERAHGRTGEPAVLVGHSRGGTVSRVVTVRRPDLVAGLITLGSPLTRPFATHLSLKLVKLGMRAASRLGARGLVRECAFGACCRRFHEDLLGPFPGDVPFVSVFSESDGLVDPDASRDPAAKHVVLDVTHSGLGLAPAALQTVSQLIDGFPAPAPA